MINLRDRNEYFDERYVVFGRIIAGYDFIENVCAQVERKEEKPIRPITIVNAGELRFDGKLLGQRNEVDEKEAKGVWTGSLEFLNNYDRNVYEEDEKRAA